jgi:hypothetical protein
VMEEGQKGFELAKAFLEIEALEEKTF